jgi:Protein of unknown function (DUF3224)
MSNHTTHTQRRVRTLAVALVGLTLGLGTAARSEERAATMSHVTGSFDVKVSPLTDEGGNAFGRMGLDKRYHGDLDATAVGQMLSTRSETGGAYVALERVTGTLQGRTGTFELVHRGEMTSSSQKIEIWVVTGSGTGQLAGISGRMGIRIEAGGKHFYDFDYELPATADTAPRKQ